MKNGYKAILFFVVVLMFATSCDTKGDISVDPSKQEQMSKTGYLSDESWIFVPTRYSVPLSVRTTDSLGAEEYFYFGGIRPGMTYEEVLAVSESTGWFDVNHDYKIGDESAFDMHATLFTKDADLISVNTEFKDNVVTKVDVTLWLDITDPDFDEFRKIYSELFREFQLKEDVTLSLFEYPSYVPQKTLKEDYIKSGYVKNETMAYYGENQYAAYFFITEHYSKPDPDSEHFETENIAVITFRKNVLEK